MQHADPAALRPSRLAPLARSALSALGCAASIAAAQVAPDSTLERVEITGSRLSQLDAETALPVDVIRREQIERSGATTVEELLTRLSASAHTDKEASRIGSLQSPGYSSLSIRIFDGAATLILLDGRRLANYPFSAGSSPGVDLNAIPLAAIERVEILKDGASAIYGSDALGGVVNFILKKDFRGGAGEVGGGASQHGGGARANAAALFGQGDLGVDGYNVFVALDARRQSPIVARDRSFAATGYRPEEGLDATSIAGFPANINVGGGRFVNPAAPACTPSTIPRGAMCRGDPFAWTTILPKTETLSLLSSGVLRLGATGELYAELLSTQQRFESQLSPQAVNPGTLGLGPLLLPQGSLFYPTGLGLSGDLDVRYRSEPLGPRASGGVANQGRALIGWRGDAAGWAIDSALALARGRATNEYRHGYIDSQAIVDAFATGLVNPFGASDAAGNALLAGSELRGISRRAKSTTDSIDVRARRDLAQWQYGPVALAVGAEARRESIRDEATAVAGRAVGAANSSDFISAVEGKRRSQAIFAELGLPLVPKLEALLAARTDRFSDFGTTTSPKAALRWQPSSWLVVRGSVGRGFRAPSLGELYSPQQSAFVPTGLPDLVRCPVTGAPADCNVEATLVFGGNPSLQPMRTKQTTVGLVVRPARDATLGLEFWRVTTTGYISQQSVPTALSGAPELEGPVVVRGPSDPATPGLPGPITKLRLTNQNIGRFQASGIDVDAKWAQEVAGIGKVWLALNGEYTTEVSGQFDGVTNSSVLGATSIEGLVAARWTHRLALGLDHHPWATTLAHRLRSSYVDLPVNGFPDRRVATEQVWNAQLAWKGWRTPLGETTLVFGIDNLTDRDPPFTRRFANGYDPTTGEPRGRFYYVALRLRSR
ncbi:MAG: TonB-dependent receptor [Caldimonas sp.]